MVKKIQFTQFIDAKCVIKEFDSFAQACKFVFDNYWTQHWRTYSKTTKKKIHKHIKDAVDNKNDYCGGQWIEVNKNSR